jgi:transposase
MLARISSPLLVQTALVALVGDIERFHSGHYFASYLGLTPREDSTALHRRLGAISKQGDTYVRMLLIPRRPVGLPGKLVHAPACVAQTERGVRRTLQG